jgi:regulator of sigma E protease
VSWVLTLLGICALIVLHELGHFTAAKLVGMRVERFSLFFPPTLFRVRRGETEYAVGAIPLGGYVKIMGMNPEELKPGPARRNERVVAAAERVPVPTVAAVASASSAMTGHAPAAAQADPAMVDTAEETVDPELLRRAYYNQPPWKRVVVIAAGPAVNLLIAFLIFWVILMSGNLAGVGSVERLNPSIQTQVPAASVAAIEKGTPAVGVLRAGDKILSVEGKRVGTVSTEQGIVSTERAIDAHPCAGRQVNGCRAATPVQLLVRRDGRTLALSVYPRYSQSYKRMLVGFVFGTAPKHYGPLAAAGLAVREMWGMTTSMISSLGHAFTSSKVRHELHSIVGITEIAHETVIAGAGYALVFLAFISLVLAVINLFPFLPLDGGHILWAVAEKVRGRRISLAAMYRFSSVGIILLVFLVVNGISNDISRLAG